MNANTQLNVIREVMGDIVAPFVPSVTMKVTYGNHEVINSSVLKPVVTQTTPRVVIGGESNALYTLVMIDPDAPNPNAPTMQEVVAWIVTNIPGGTSCAQGTEFAEYEKPDPEIGIHRFIMFLYKQKSPLDRIDALESRVGFKSRDFATKHKLGRPVGVSYFHVRRQVGRNAKA